MEIELTAYDKAKRDLESKLPEYIEKVGEFQIKNEKWKIIDYFTLKHNYLTCMVCGKSDIIHVFVIQNVETKKRNDNRQCLH